MKQVADGIRAIIQGLEMVADALENYEVVETTTTEVTVEAETEEPTQEAETPTPEAETPAQEAEPPKKRNGSKKTKEPTEADVRKLLSGKAQAGFTAEVKALLAKYGTTMISKLEEKDYAAVMQEAEGIK